MKHLLSITLFFALAIGLSAQPVVTVTPITANNAALVSITDSDPQVQGFLAVVIATDPQGRETVLSQVTLVSRSGDTYVYFANVADVKSVRVTALEFAGATTVQ